MQEQNYYPSNEVNKALLNLKEKEDTHPLKALISHGLDLNARHFLLDLEDELLTISMTEKLCSLGLDIKGYLPIFETPIWFSLFQNITSESSVDSIIALPGINLNQKDKQGNSIFTLLPNYINRANSSEETDKLLYPILKSLIAAGADYLVTNNRQENLLFDYNAYPKCLKYLLSLNLDIEGLNKNKMTPFMDFCAYLNDPQKGYELTKIWLESGVNIQKQRDDPESYFHGWTALFFAVKGKQQGIVKALLEEKPDLHYRSPKGDSPLSIALTYRFEPFISLFTELLENPFSEAIHLEKMLAYHIFQEEWEEALQWGQRIEKANLGSALSSSYFSSAYRKLGHYDKALAIITKAIQEFGVDPLLWDTILITQVYSGLFQEAVAFWFKHKKEFKADQGPAANILAHLIVAFDQINRTDQAISELYPLLDQAKNTEVSKQGLLEFNIACMFAKTEQVERCIELCSQALKKDYLLYDFEDSDFDPIREKPLFELFLNFNQKKVLYHHYVKKEKQVTLYCSYFDEYDVIRFTQGKYQNQKKEFTKEVDLLIQYNQDKQALEREGYKEKLPDFISIWLPVFDEIFKRISAESLGPLGELRLEWDFYNGDSLEENPLERPYYAYSDNGFDIDHYDYILHIPLKSIHSEVLKKATELESFLSLEKKDEVLLIQSEHDSGDEFTYRWEKSEN